MPDHPPPPLRQGGSGRPHRPEIVAAARALVEGSTLSLRAIGRELGASAAAIQRWARREGWVRPPSAPTRGNRPGRAGAGAERRRLAAERVLRDAEAGRPLRARRSRGEPHRADTVEAARRLFVGTELGLPAIARRVRIGHATVARWAERRGWERPPGARLAPNRDAHLVLRPVSRLRAASARAERVAERYLATLRASPEPDPEALAWAAALRARARDGARVRRRRRPAAEA